MYYPKVGSSKLFSATVLDYNPLQSRPYYVEYDDTTTEHIVPNRINMGVQREEGGEEVVGVKKERKGGKKKEVCHDLFNVFAPK